MSRQKCCNFLPVPPPKDKTQHHEKSQEAKLVASKEHRKIADTKSQDQQQNPQMFRKLLLYQNSAMLKNNNQHERSLPDKPHGQNHNKRNRQASKKDKYISDQSTNHEEVKLIEEIEAIEEIEEADRIVEGINSEIHNQVKVSEANKVRAHTKEIIEHYEVKNGFHQDQVAHEAIEIHQVCIDQGQEAKQDTEISNHVPIATKQPTQAICVLLSIMQGPKRNSSNDRKPNTIANETEQYNNRKEKPKYSLRHKHHQHTLGLKH